jgi:two-component system response regulator
VHHLGSILLAEDSEDDVFLLRRAFLKASVRQPLRVAHDGDALVACLEDPRHDLDPLLVLLDLKLPLRGGLEALAWMRATPRLRRIPIVVLSSSLEPRDVAAAYDLGANAYLVKPMGLEDLENLVRCVKSFWLEYNITPATAVAP